MGYKALLLLVIFMVTILLTYTEEAPRDLLHEKFDQNDVNNNDPAQTLDESKQYHGGDRHEFGGRGGHGGGFGGRGGYSRGNGGRGSYGRGFRGRGGYGGGYGGPWGHDEVYCHDGRCCAYNLHGCSWCCPPLQSAHEANKIDAKNHA
ncbi:hypothetical protein PIB30_101359 [Stylosanthes scabra]|uniref:Glycine-rich protein n=1 Tax=Stylosanthes scabra TaxID=79078 RepID=A0ABU6XY44_9FABA|nr:hypothetical protein [Stylosanthes scabra]